jgi:hypothetical protein
LVHDSWVVEVGLLSVQIRRKGWISKWMSWEFGCP